jgi:hypothetical protein
MVMIREGMRGGSASTSSASKAAKTGRLVGRGGAAVGRDPELEELEYQEKMRAYTRAMISEANDDNAAEHYRRQFLSVFFQKPILSNEEADFQPNPVVSSPEKARQPPTCWNVHQEGNAAGGAVDRFLVEKHAPVREKIRTIVNAEREREIEERVKAIPAVNGSKKIMQVQQPFHHFPRTSTCTRGQCCSFPSFAPPEASQLLPSMIMQKLRPVELGVYTLLMCRHNRFCRAARFEAFAGSRQNVGQRHQCSLRRGA